MERRSSLHHFTGNGYVYLDGILCTPSNPGRHPGIPPGAPRGVWTRVEGPVATRRRQGTLRDGAPREKGSRVVTEGPEGVVVLLGAEEEHWVVILSGIYYRLTQHTSEIFSFVKTCVVLSKSSPIVRGLDTAATRGSTWRRAYPN